MAGRSREREWQTVTVALPPGPCLNQQVGHRLARRCWSGPRSRRWRPWSRCPSGSASAARRRASPDGRRSGRRVTSLPTFTGWKPSTSLPGSIRRSTWSVSMCLGSGSWTSIPWMVGSAFSRSTVASSSGLGGLGGEPDGDRVHARFLAGLALAPHVDLAGGVLAHQHHRQTRRHAPWVRSRAASTATSSRIARPMATPSRIRALTGRSPRRGSPESRPP